MATTLLVQVQFARDNGLVRDAVVNTWHFRSYTADPTDWAVAITTSLDDFYSSIGTAFSPVLTGDALVRIYDLAAPVPRTPVFESDFTITPDSSTPLPSECAVALSYRGTLVSGSPPARRRGRIFLGPWSVDALATGANDGQVALATYEAIRDAAQVLSDEGSNTTWEWAVFSPTTAGAPPWSDGELQAATLAVVAGHVDNAFDTIRSRGAAATARAIFTD